MRIQIAKTDALRLSAFKLSHAKVASRPFGVNTPGFLRASLAFLLKQKAIKSKATPLLQTALQGRGLGEPTKLGEGRSPTTGVRARERSEERGCNPLRVGVNKIAKAIVITPLAGAIVFIVR